MRIPVIAARRRAACFGALLLAAAAVSVMPAAPGATTDEPVSSASPAARPAARHTPVREKQWLKIPLSYAKPSELVKRLTRPAMAGETGGLPEGITSVLGIDLDNSLLVQFSDPAALAAFRDLLRNTLDVPPRQVLMKTRLLRYVVQDRFGDEALLRSAIIADPTAATPLGESVPVEYDVDDGTLRVTLSPRASSARGEDRAAVELAATLQQVNKRNKVVAETTALVRVAPDGVVRFAVFADTRDPLRVPDALTPDDIVPRGARKGDVFYVLEVRPSVVEDGVGDVTAPK